MADKMLVFEQVSHLLQCNRSIAATPELLKLFEEKMGGNAVSGKLFGVLKSEICKNDLQLMGVLLEENGELFIWQHVLSDGEEVFESIQRKKGVKITNFIEGSWTDDLALVAYANPE